LAAGLSAVLPNEFLMWHSYALYGLQAATMMPYLLRKSACFADLFIPTFLVLAYFLANLTLGSYLVPRDYGWDKEFAATALDINQYKVIVPFLLLCNVGLFLLTASTLRALEQRDRRLSVTSAGEPRSAPGALLSMSCYFAAFLAVSYYGIYGAFSFQLALLILHLTNPSLHRRWYRYLAYAFYLVVMLAFSYENKREIAMALFAITFLETYHARYSLRLSPVAIAGYVVLAGSFFGLIMMASILRGYGDFPVASVIEAVSYVPQYMTSEMFIDGIVDNLELNYNYGVAITSIDYGMRGLIDYQYGASFIKIFFLPIPRDFIPIKPESMMQIFTQAYAPEWWGGGGSLPVMFASDMFLNFHYLGLIPFMLVWMVINLLFVKIHTAAPRSFVALSCIFICMTVLMLARGSGLELWLLYYLIAAPLFVVFNLLRNLVSVNGRSRWIV
jgi:hypothetical protein